MTNDELERQAFEAWLKNRGYRTDRDVRGEYVFSYAASTWQGWQARANLEKSDGSES